MYTLKTLIIYRFQTIGLLFISILLSLVLLALRIKLNQSFFYLFLVWNLFLAAIPYMITTYMISVPSLPKFIKIGLLLLWLLFLPNAPYIITDLLHLKYATSKMLWLDVLMVSSFAINGLVLFFLSLKDFENLLLQNINRNVKHIIIISTCFLTGFGMYIGRFLRFNSWDIIQNPTVLISEVFDILIAPKQHFEAWIFTASFGCFLCFTYYLILNLKMKSLETHITS
jgi:uncharacterized membrane protein